MKIKITGTHLNGHPFVGYYPKESLTLAQAEALISSFDKTEINALSDGSPVDHSSILLELYDDEFVEDVDMARFKGALYLNGKYDLVNNDMNAQNGIVKIFWDTSPSISYYHPLFQQCMDRLKNDVTVDEVKSFFKQAREIP